MTTKTRVRALEKGTITKGDRNPTLPLSTIPHVVDLNTLEGEVIHHSIYNRGVELHKMGRVRVNTLYPWRFTVSGTQHDLGAALYFVDLSTYECSCPWWKNNHSTCKHMVAALLTYMEKTTLV
jgi:hypothetical protein